MKFNSISINSSGPVWVRVLIALLFVQLCAVSTVAAQSQEQWPQWLKEGMSKESEGLKPVPYTIKDLNLTLELPGSLSDEAQLFDDVWYLPIDIKSPSIMECYVYSSDTDPANLVATLANYNMQVNAEAYGVVGNEEIHALEIGNYDAYPYLSIEWFYTMGEGSKAVLGLIKSRVAVINEFTLGCVHNLVGYRETFTNSFENMVRSARNESTSPMAYYQEINILKINNQKIGFSIESFTLDSDGDTEVRSLSSILVPRSKSDLSAVDTTSIGFSRPDGSVINRHHYTVQDDELTMGLSLEKDDDDKWRVSGEISGKEYEQTLAYEGSPVSRFGQLKQVKDLVLADGKNASIDAWVPSADPSKIISMDIKITGDAANNKKIFYTMGPMKIDGSLDSAGTLTGGTMVVGNQQIDIERVWKSGDL